MKFIIVEEEGDSIGEIDRMRAIIVSSGQEYKERDVDVYLHSSTYSQERMTLHQLLKLWKMCGNYKVPFREDDYIRHSMSASMTKGYVEGWVGGRQHDGGRAEEKATIYVGVSPTGESYT